MLCQKRPSQEQDFQQRPEGGGGLSHRDTGGWREHIPHSTGARALGQVHAWCIRENANAPGGSGRGGKSYPEDSGIGQ